MKMRKSHLGKWLMLTSAILAVVFAAQGGSSKLPFSWKNPNYTGGSFKNVLVLAMNGRSEGRADFEDGMVAQLTRQGVTATPSYSLLPRPKSTPINMDDLRWQIQQNKFDAVIVSRVVRLDKSVKYVSGSVFPLYPYYGTLYGYYGTLAPVVYTPGYMEHQTSAQVETNVYSTAKPDGELAWTATSKTVNPGSLKKAIDGVVKLLMKSMAKDNII
jgi:hypothetical protein